MSQVFSQVYGKARTFVRAYPRTILAGVVVGLVFGSLATLFEPPAHFPAHVLIEIPEGTSSPVIAHALKEAHVIRSETVFTLLARLTGDATHLSGGTYEFPEPLSIFSIISRVAHGDFGITEDRITFTEGMTTKDMADTLAASLPGFNSQAFFTAASTSEGYLFPDTYFILPGTGEKDIVARLQDTFIEKTASSSAIFAASGHSLRDIVIVASILEREAKSPEDMQHVSGILWNRIRLGMPLQVDAVFGYIHGEDGYTPTAADLASDSPYNTYKNKGLPPTAIDNPGLAALLAAAQPLPTKDLYYLTGKDGAMHYAQTFAQHKKNRALYLDI